MDDLPRGSTDNPESAARYPHLRPSAASLVEASENVRLQDVARPRWIGYPAAQALIEEIEDLMLHPRSGMMPNLLIVSPPRNGKTSIVHRLKTVFPPEPQQNGKLSMPVIHFDMPAPARETDFWFSFLEKMRISAAPSAKATALRTQASRSLATIDCRLIVIDEMHHLQTASRQVYFGLVGMLKNLSNAIDMPILFLGTDAAIDIVSRSAEIGGRIEISELPRWQYGDDFRAFLGNLERTLPFPEPSGLSGPELSRLLYERSDDGIIGWVIRRIQLAAAQAIREGKRSIGATEIESVTVRSLKEMRTIPRF